MELTRHTFKTIGIMSPLRTHLVLEAVFLKQWWLSGTPSFAFISSYCTYKDTLVLSDERIFDPPKKMDLAVSQICRPCNHCWKHVKMIIWKMQLLGAGSIPSLGLERLGINCSKCYKIFGWGKVLVTPQLTWQPPRTSVELELNLKIGAVTWKSWWPGGGD